MEFRIADTFTESLARLTGEEQKAVKITAFDLQMDPAQPGMQLHKLDKARDPNFLSVRVSRDIRLIVHRTVSSLLLCYVDHHDHAYRWAERRKLETHPKTGAAQLVEIRETVADDADLEEVYNTERHLLYVACTRARDHLLVTSVDPASEFLDDLRL
jgi:mRNA-degrading endonuclease RelE of RelBE toxin-antitoxin system